MTEIFAQATTEVENNPILNITIFAAFVAVTLFIVLRASRNNKTASDYYAGGRSFSGPQNGFAISGDYLSAASFLGICGAIAVNGYDGFLYSIGFLVAWLVALLLVAELMRNTGKFTMADVLSFRLRRPGAHGRGDLDAGRVLLLPARADGRSRRSRLALMGIDGKLGQSLVIAVVGALMILYVLVGGMKGTTWVQIVKAVLLIAGAGAMTIWVLALNGFNLSTLLSNAVANAAEGVGEGRAQSRTPVRLEPARLHLTRPRARPRHRGSAARAHALLHGAHGPGGAAVGGLGDLAHRRVLSLHPRPRLRCGRARRRRCDQERSRRGELRGSAARPPARGSAAHGLHLRGRVRHDPRRRRGARDHRAASFAHDIYASVIKKGKVEDPDAEVKIARRTVVVIGAVAILGGIGVQGQNIAFLVALAFAVAASANLPTIIYSLFWRRFTTRGAVWSIYGGLGSAILLIAFSPVVSGSETAMIPGADFAIFPLSNPGIISIPLGFILGWLGSITDRTVESPELAAEMDVRAHTGFGAEAAVEH